MSLLALAVLLAVAVVAVPLERERRQAKALTARVNQARVAALIAAKTRDEIARLIRENNFLADCRRNTRRTVKILNELIRLTPDHTWLRQLRIQENVVRLTGLSGGASGLIRVIEQSS